MVICDRSVLDNYAYMVHQAGRQPAYDALVQKWVGTYDGMFKVPVIEPPSFDGKRDVSAEFQHAIDATIDQLARELGVEFCPHWLGGGVGLAASLHLRASLGEQGWAEVDANPNPLREAVCPLEVRDGWVQMPDTPGIGVDPTQCGIDAYRVALA